LTNATCAGGIASVSGRAKVVLRANFTGANLSNAKLNGADLRNAKFRRANLTGAVADSRTKWPLRFNPAAAGVLLAQETMQ
jgi:uncharacterized protein YjbI with pentapeptide repeats